MGLFDKIKSTVSEVTQKTEEWVSDNSSKTKSSLNETFDKLTSSINHKDIRQEQLPSINLEDSEQVSAEDVNQLNGKAGKIINDLIARIKEQLNKVDIDELLSALQEYQEKTGKNLTPLIEFIKQLSETLSEVATKGVLGILILLRDTPFNTIIKLAKSIVKLIPVPGIPIIIMILEMMIKVEWLLKKVLDILIKKIEKKQAIKSKKQVVVEFLNNDNTKTEWTIAILEEGTIIVFENGSQTENTKSSLRYIAEYIGFSYDKSWTTRQFGSKLIDHIHSLQEQDVK